MKKFHFLLYVFHDNATVVEMTAQEQKEKADNIRKAIKSYRKAMLNLTVSAIHSGCEQKDVIMASEYLAGSEEVVSAMTELLNKAIFKYKEMKRVQKLPR